MLKLKKLLRKRLNKLHFLIVTVAILVLAGVTYAAVGNNPPQDSPTSTPSPGANTTSGPKVDLNPATPEEKKASDDYKKSLTQPPPAPPTTPTGKKQVYPIITGASHSEVNAYVSGLIEDGGTCTATATQGSQTVTASSYGFVDVNKTSCEPIPVSLPPGTWSVVVSYSSALYEGSSQAFEVN